MFDSIKKIFEKFSFTDEESDDERRRPILVNLPVSYCFKAICDYTKGQPFTDVVIKEDFNEIYYVDGKDEISLILLANQEGKTIISCHVLSGRRGKSRAKLYETLKVIDGLLNKGGQ